MKIILLLLFLYFLFPVCPQSSSPTDSTSFLGLSKIYYNQGNIAIAEQYCRLALKKDPCNSDAHHLLGRIYFKEGKIDSCEIELLLALKCNSDNKEAHRDLGKGLNAHDYSIYPELQQYTKERNMVDSLLHLGNSYWITGEYIKSKAAFGIILNKYPLYGLAHYGYYMALSGIAENDLSDRDTAICNNNYSFEDTTSANQIFINLNEFPQQFQRVVKYSVHPFAKFLLPLKESGATFEILSLYEKLTDNPKRKYLEGTRTPDKRLWDDVGGNGGINATISVGAIWDAMHNKYNEFAHEFAHQIHLFTLTEEEKAQINDLYAKARIFLDDYAKTNVLEYFAVGYEAYLAIHKGPDQGEYHGHTREELLKKDKPFYDFIWQLTQKKDVSENIIAGRKHKREYEEIKSQ